MASLRDLYKECQAVVRSLSLQFAKVEFNKSLCRLLTNKYVACLTYLDNYIIREDGSIHLPCKTALVELRRIMSCGQRLVTQWTQKDWWMSVITSSDSASLDKTVILHLREFLACVNVLLPMEANMTYGPALDSLDSSVQQACRTDIEGLILSMKQYRRGIISASKFAKLAKHLSEKLEREISNHQHPYVIDIPLDVEISYQGSLGSGSFGTVFKCTFLGVEAAAKVWKTNCINEKAAEKEASLFSKLRHPNVAQFIGYGVKERQPVIVSELMSTDLRRYLDENKKNAGEGPPLPLLVALNILLQIAEAMNYLHENGVMHRDLKANNVLINVVEDQDGHLSSSSLQVKLTDFGLSKLKLHDSQYTTPMVGTTRWRAPEAFEDKENREKYTKSADVYSFSMLCFEVLTGDVPFKDKPLVTLLESIRDGVRPQLPDVDYCPDYLSALIKKCWATDATERPQFPMICQLLVDYKAMLLKHPFGQEDVPTDCSQNSQPVDAADTANTTYFIEDDNNYIASRSAISSSAKPLC
jgi:predicted Ser/Thr protein kinase